MFTKQGEFTNKVTNLPDVPSPSYTAAQIKGAIQQPSEDLKTTFNKLVDGLNGTKWVDEPKLGDSSVSRRTIQPGAVGTNEIDPDIMNQPTTAIGVQAKFDSIDSQLADNVSSINVLKSRTKGVYDISEFGAKTTAQDSTFDNTQAFNDAYASLDPYAVLTIPYGDFNIEGTLLPKRAILTKGIGKGLSRLIQRTSGQVGIHIDAITNVLLNAFSIVGTGTKGTGEKAIFISGADYGGHLFKELEISNTTLGIHNESYGSKILFSDFCDIIGDDGVSEGYGVLNDGGGDMDVLYNYFNNIMRHGVYLSAGSSRVNVLANRFKTLYNAAVQVYSKSSLSQSWCEDIIIQSNQIHDVLMPTNPATGQWRGGVIMTGQVRNSKVLDNIVRNVYEKAVMLESSSDGIPEDILLSRNNIQKGASGNALDAFVISGATGYEMTKNIQAHFNTVVGGSNYGFLFSGVDGLKAKNNVARDTTNFGIKLSTTCTNATLADNVSSNGISNEGTGNLIRTPLSNQPNSTATDLPTLVAEFNALLGRLQDADLMI